MKARPSYDIPSGQKGSGGISSLKNRYGVEIRLEKVEHRYFDQHGNEYDSVSRLLNRYGSFDTDAISKRVADRKGVSQEEILKEWDKKRDSASDYGTLFHDAQEEYFHTGMVPEKAKHLKPLIEMVEKILFAYKTQLLEKTIASFKYGVAGTIDRLCYRQSFGKGFMGAPVLDLFDYKTNQAKGIQFKNDYGSYMKEPFDYLEDCNFVKYSMQLSVYAKMLEDEYGIKVGRLAILDVSSGKFPVVVPVMYMRGEAERILELGLK